MRASERPSHPWLAVAASGAGRLLVYCAAPGTATLSAALRRRPFARFMKILTLIGSAATLLMSPDYLAEDGH